MASNPPGVRGPASPKASEALAPEDVALLDRVARRIVELRMEVPAILTLETGRPLTVLAGQTMYFFEPMIGALLRMPDYRRFAQLIERRETIETLIRLIEGHADTAHAERQAAAAARRAAKKAQRGRRGRGPDPS